MNHYEKVLLDKMVDMDNSRREAIANNDIHQYNNDIRMLENDILLLLDCICEFREPPREIQVEEGYGAMVVAG